MVWPRRGGHSPDTRVRVVPVYLDVAVSGKGVGGRGRPTCGRRSESGGRRVTANENALTTPAQWVKSEALLPETVPRRTRLAGVVTRLRPCV
ncbi:hypothetical protein MRX96_038135 [Rhipicephalus microplus]